MSIEEELARQQTAESGLGGAQPQMMAQTTTAPMGADPAPALQSSAPSSSGGNASGESAPLSQPGPNESQGGGVDFVKDRGDPATMINNMPAGQLETMLERSARSVANAKPATEGALEDPMMQEIKVKSQKLQMNNNMSAQGADPEKGIQALYKERMKIYDAARAKGDLTKEHHTALKDRWKNIFNIVPKEDMGLFLMDFGFRAMMAGETMGDAAAIGAAGAGALAGSQGRRQKAVDDEIADSDRAMEGALDTYKAESDRMTSEASRTNAAANTVRADAIGGGYQGEKVWLNDFFSEAGWSKQQIADYFGKAKGPAARRQDLTDALLKRIEGAGIIDVDPILGKPLREFGNEDIQLWVDQVLGEEDRAARASSALDIALERN
jgi:hypothetical protein